MGFFITFILLKNSIKTNKMRLHFLTLTAILTTFFFNAQEPKKLDTTLSGQFDEIYRISTSYQTYKVISKDKFIKLKQNVLDTIQINKNIIAEKDNTLKAERKTIKVTKDTLTATRLKLDAALEKEDSISLFGLLVSKIIYSVILWSLIILLLLALLYFIFKFSRNNILTKKAESNLKNVEVDYEQYRKKALEREQKLRRELQDEINKQRNS